MTDADAPAAADAPLAPVAASAAVEIDTSPARQPVYTPNQIAFATLLGTPIAGALLASANFARAGKAGVGRVVVALCAVVVAVVVGLDAWGYGALTLKVSPIWAVAAFLLATPIFGLTAARHGGRANVGVAFAVAGVWTALLVVGSVVALAVHSVPSPNEIASDAVTAGPDEVVTYDGADGANRSDAERVVQALKASGYFTGAAHLHLALDRAADARLRLTILAAPPVSAYDVDLSRTMTRHVAAALQECVKGRLVGPNGAELASGTSCP